MSDELLAIREFARRDGCDEARVRRGVRRGELPTRPDRLLPASLAGTAWRAGNRLPGAEGAPPKRTKRLAAEAMIPAVSLAEAVRLREIALAGLKRHELATMRAQWISREELEAAWEEIVGVARHRLLQVPAAAAPRVVACVRVGEVQAVLTDVIYDALTELSEHDFAASVKPYDASPMELPAAASMVAAETAKVFAQGNVRQLQVAIAAGRMILLEEEEESGGRAIEVARQRMLHIPAAMPPRLFGRRVEQIEAALRRVVVEALDELEIALLPSRTPKKPSSSMRRHAG